MMHLEDILSKADSGHYVKKEINHFQKLHGRLEKSVGGIRTLRYPVGAIVVADVRKDYVAVREAQYCGIPVIGLVDTNADPSGIDYVIPTNDDAPKALEVVLNYLAQATLRGQEVARAASPAEDAAASAGENVLERMLETVLKEDEEGDKKSGPRRGGSGRGAAGRRSPSVRSGSARR
jgi:small subunit ribosomal protein S2